MEKYFNLFLAKALKQWVAQARIPANGRERLLKKAADPRPQASHKFSFSWVTGQEAVRPEIFSVDWPLKLSDWLYYSFRPGYGTLSVD